MGRGNLRIPKGIATSCLTALLAMTPGGTQRTRTPGMVIPEIPRGLPRRACGTPRNDTGGQLSIPCAGFSPLRPPVCGGVRRDDRRTTRWGAIPPHPEGFSPQRAQRTQSLGNPPACGGTKGGIDRSNLSITLRVSAFLLITLMENPLSNSSSNITKSAKGTELIHNLEFPSLFRYIEDFTQFSLSC